MHDAGYAIRSGIFFLTGWIMMNEKMFIDELIKKIEGILKF